MQKQLDEDSKHRQEEIKFLSEATTTLRREIDETGMLSKSMVDWTTSEQNEEIRALQTNNIALKGSFKETEKAFGKVHAEHGLWRTFGEAIHEANSGTRPPGN